MELTMIRIASAMLLAAFTTAASADRITELNRTELCVYTAKLHVAGYFYYLQGTARADVKIHWHSDETKNEIDFVTRTIDAAYLRADALKRAGPHPTVSEQQFGDDAYIACMTGQSL
jgi:hypothetical protein